MSQMQMEPEFEFSRDGLREKLKYLVSPIPLEDEVLAYIEKNIPFSSIEQAVKKKVVTERYVLEKVEMFARIIRGKRDYPIPDHLREITTDDVQRALATIKSDCPIICS